MPQHPVWSNRSASLPHRRTLRAVRLTALTLTMPCALAVLSPSAWSAGAWAATPATATAAALVGSATAPPDPVFPSQQEVDAAKKAAAAGATRVTQIEQEYAAAQQRLFVLQQEVSDAMAALADAQAELDLRSAALSDAEAEARAASERRERAATSLRHDAALMYQDQSGPLGQLTAFLSGQGPQEIADYTSALGQVAEQRRATLKAAADASNIAQEATRRADVARRQQAQARQVADEAAQAATYRANAALAESERIQAEQQRRVAELARLRHVAVKVEQERQDGLAAEAARRAAEEAARRRAAAEAARRAAEEAARRKAAEAARRKAAEQEAARRLQASRQATRTPSLSPSAPTGGGGDPRGIAKGLLGSYGWGMGQWSCLDQLWVGESGWTWSALNPSSGAYGIPQALPASKMASAGPDWLTNPRTQIVWGMNYIKGRYGTPCAAWSFWLSQSPHWY